MTNKEANMFNCFQLVMSENDFSNIYKKHKTKTIDVLSEQYPKEAKEYLRLTNLKKMLIEKKIITSPYFNNILSFYYDNIFKNITLTNTEIIDIVFTKNEKQLNPKEYLALLYIINKNSYIKELNNFYFAKLKLENTYPSVVMTEEYINGLKNLKVSQPILTELYNAFDLYKILKNALGDNSKVREDCFFINTLNYSSYADLFKLVDEVDKEKKTNFNKILKYTYLLNVDKKIIISKTLEYIIDREMNKNTGNDTVMKLSDVEIELKKRIAENIPDLKLNNQFLKECYEYAMNNKYIYIYKNNIHVTLYDIRKCEVYSEKLINRLLELDEPYNVPNLTPEMKNGITLNDGQFKAVKNILSTKYGFYLLIGAAGTGKTTTINKVIEVLKEEHNNNFKTTLLTPTAKAADVLSGSTNIRANTIHSHLQTPIDADLLIVDEAGMMDIKLFYQLMKLIRNPKIKIVLLGDKNQIPSVDRGMVLRDLEINSNIPVNILTEVKRQGAGSDIYQYSQQVINYNKYKYDKNHGDVLPLNLKDFNRIDAELEKNGYYDNINNSKIISPIKAGSLGIFNLNRTIQLNLAMKYNKSNPYSFMYYQFFKDDLIMIKKNKFINTINGEKIKLFNGQEGVVTDVLTDGIIIEVDGNKFKIDEELMMENFVVLSYAITIHESQGSGYKYVYLIIDYSNHAFFLMNSNLLYTAITRAKDKLYYYYGTTQKVSKNGRKYTSNVLSKLNFMDYNPNTKFFDDNK